MPGVIAIPGFFFLVVLAADEDGNSGMKMYSAAVC
ncbi:hypothetical protein Desti_1181 [Desulfomonile tiedjei DSM 6799]|uniref:Uncharacterized protein n=1 Tax=Desulfomonile tiedjei (strain ATCC 49306 / DSM 6799 / DCB-1) TaxID=706587 RepID=I4C2V3_DESTA|nr:hypothetical protein Desti_1181 [Desulfomonile tiedjei DSM 6799]